MRARCSRIRISMIGQNRSTRLPEAGERSGMSD